MEHEEWFEVSATAGGAGAELLQDLSDHEVHRSTQALVEGR
jgi:hypothetical protein